jgi:hypothetical protein
MSRWRVPQLGLLLAVIVLVPRLVAAQTNALFLESQPGEPVGEGQHHVLSPGNATFVAARNDKMGVSIQVQVPDTGATWYLDFSATDNVPLRLGPYRSARRFPSSRFNGFSVRVDRLACNRLTGWYQVREVEYASDGTVVRFAADFEQHCDDVTPALFGAIRFNSTIAQLQPFDGLYPLYTIAVDRPTHGVVTADEIACSSAGVACSAEYVEARGLALRAIPDPGYQLAGWGGDCQGGNLAVLVVNGPKHCTAQFAPVAPSAPRSSFAFESEADADSSQSRREYIGQGEEHRYVPSTSRMGATVLSPANHVRFHVDTQDDTSWTIELRAPNDGPLVPGAYNYARAAGSSRANAGLDFSGDGRRCDAVTGAFVVYESAFAADGTVQAFAADFEQQCDGMPLRAFGAIRYHSRYPDVLPFGGQRAGYRLTLVPAVLGALTGGPFDCGAQLPRHCTAAFASPAAVALTAVPVPGRAFEAWTDDCRGGGAATKATVSAPVGLCGARFSLPRLTNLAVNQPAIVGAPVSWTASATAPTGVEYAFWRYDAGSGWTEVQSYSNRAEYTWTPTDADVGEHFLQVWMRRSGTAALYEDWRGLGFTVGPKPSPVLRAFAANREYPVIAGGTGVTWTATAATAAAPLQYQFWRLDADGWRIVQPYGPANTYTWTPTTADQGPHALQVWVRNAGSSAAYEGWRATTFDVVLPPPVIVAFETDGPPAIGRVTTWSVRSTGGIGPVVYQFWRLDADGWHMVQDYSSTATYAWTPTSGDAGAHALQVWAKSAGSVRRYDTWQGMAFTLALPPPASVSIDRDR